MRFHSAPVIRLADAKPLHLGHTIQADGRWRLLAFAPAENPIHALTRLGEFLSSLASPTQKYTPKHADPDSLIDIRAILQQPHATLALDSMPPYLLPQKGRHALTDYEKIFCPDFKSADIFKSRHINRETGCLIIIRPDQYVANILPLNAHAALAAFFDAFLLPPTPAPPGTQSAHAAHPSA